LGAEVIDFGGFAFGEEFAKARAIGEVAIMQGKAGVGRMRVLIDVVNAIGIKRAGAPDEAVDIISFAQQQFGEVGAVLSGNACDQGAFGAIFHERVSFQATALGGTTGECPVAIIAIIGGFVNRHQRER
jgi:hypothetical protein